MHLQIASAASGNPDEVVAAIAASKGIAHRVEVRLDAFWAGPPTETDAAVLFETLFEASATHEVPLLMTLRPKRQGGAFEGPEDVRISLLTAAARLGAAVDLENDHPLIDKIAAVIKAEGQPVILSDHRFTEAPRTEEGLKHLQSMQDLQGARDKLAFPCGSFMDNLRALELAHIHSGRLGRPAIAPIGGGPELRALLAIVGNQATYGHAANMRPAISGQPALSAVRSVWDHWGLDVDHLYAGGWFAVLGDPVNHSLSPRIHNAALRAACRDERYGALQVPNSIGAVRLVNSVASRIGLKGASVTAPLKMHAAATTEGDASVQATGAANCIRFGAQIQSTNTDASAMKRLLHGAQSVGVLGAGGAARAAAWAALQIGATVTVACRRPEDAEPLRKLGATVVDLEAAKAWVVGAVVQATPLTDLECALPSDRLIELVYKGGETVLEAACKKAGLHVTSGKQFLVEQAIDAYQFWTGDAPDRNAMEASL